jgi:hypothetical protein
MINGILFALFVLLQCADFYTTYASIKSGKAHEVNPFLVWLFNKIGMETGLGLIKLIVIGVGLYMIQFDFAFYFYIVANLVYMAVVYSNYKVLKG